MIKKMTNNDDPGLVRQRRGFLRVLSEERTPYTRQACLSDFWSCTRPIKIISFLYQFQNLKRQNEYTLTRSQRFFVMPIAEHEWFAILAVGFVTVFPTLSFGLLLDNEAIWKGVDWKNSRHPLFVCYLELLSRPPSGTTLHNVTALLHIQDIEITSKFWVTTFTQNIELKG